MVATISYGEASVGYLDLALRSTTGVALDPNIPPLPSAQFWEVIFKYDPLLLFIHYGFTSFWSGVGFFPRYTDKQFDELSISSPVHTFAGRDVRLDETYYASQLHSISSFATLLTRGGFPVPPLDRSENTCNHSSLTGEGVYSRPVEKPVSDSFTFNLSIVNSPSVAAECFVFNDVTYGWSPDVPLTVNVGPFNSVNIESLVRNLSSYSSIRFGDGTQFWRYAGSVSITHDGPDYFGWGSKGSLTLGGAYFPYAPVQYDWSYEVRIPRDICHSVSFPLFPGSNSYYLKPTGSIPMIFKYASCSLPYDIEHDDSFFMDHMGNQFVEIHGSLYDPLGPLEDPVLYTATLLQKSRDFSHEVVAALPDLVSSAVFSTVDALGSMDFGTHTDVLQSLVKLPKYKEMIPKISEAIRLASDVLHRDLSGETIKDIIHLFSGTTLQASFQWRPWLSFIQKDLPLIVSDWSRLFDQRQLVIGRGHWDFDFPDGSFSRRGVHLDVRTKVVMDLSGNSLAAGLLGLDGLGVLPKPSNLWDLIPFSFVLNWFTGVGSEIRNVEYSAFLLGIPAYFVHTYTLTSPLTPDELGALDLQCVRSDAPIAVKVYLRHVSVYSPLPRDTRFGFGIPQQLPPLGVIGALLIQLLLK